MACTPMHPQTTHDVFITDVDYDADETELGFVQTGLTNETVGSTLIRLQLTQDPAPFAEVKEQSIVRFTSIVANAVTDYVMVRSIDRAAFTFTVDAPLLMPAASEYRLQFVREWIPRTLKLQSRFQLVTACEVKAFAFTGLSSGNLYEGTGSVPQHDFIGLEIQEIPGTVKSTNRYMQNMLAVLPTHMPSYHPSSWIEARDAIIYLPDGLAKSTFDSPLLAVNSITPRLIDRRGQPVKAARFHLWLRLWAEVF